MKAGLEPFEHRLGIILTAIIGFLLISYSSGSAEVLRKGSKKGPLLIGIEEVSKNSSSELEKSGAGVPHSDMFIEKSTNRMLVFSLLKKGGKPEIIKRVHFRRRSSRAYDFEHQFLTTNKPNVYYYFNRDNKNIWSTALRITAGKSSKLKIEKLDCGKFPGASFSGQRCILSIYDLRDGFVMLLPELWLKVNLKEKRVDKIDLYKMSETGGTIFPMDITGGTLTDRYHFAISGDGDGVYGLNAIERINVLTGKRKRICNNLSGYTPVHIGHGEVYRSTAVPLEMSPDGKYLAFIARYQIKGRNYYEGEIWLSILDLKTNNVTRLSPARSKYRNLIAWNPAGGKLIAHLYRGEKKGIRIVNLYTGKGKTIETGRVLTNSHYKMKWSPDGEKLAWFNDKREIMICDIRTGRVTRMDDKSYFDFFWVE